jgi:hypothetical protein
MFTEYSHLQDAEIVCSVLNSAKSSSLEQELARRLGESMDAVEDLKVQLARWNPYMREPNPGVKYVGDA